MKGTKKICQVSSVNKTDVQIGTLTASTTASGNENSDEPSMNLDPVNAAKLVSTPKTQKPAKPACSPLSELLI